MVSTELAATTRDPAHGDFPFDTDAAVSARSAHIVDATARLRMTMVESMGSSHSPRRMAGLRFGSLHISPWLRKRSATESASASAST